MKRLKLAFWPLLLLVVSGFVNINLSATDSVHIEAKTLAVSNWVQVNSNGFGNQKSDEVSALEAFSSQLYAGTSNSTDGAQIFRSPDGVTWTPVTDPGFGNSHDTAPPQFWT